MPFKLALSANFISFVVVISVCDVCLFWWLLRCHVHFIVKIPFQFPYYFYIHANSRSRVHTDKQIFDAMVRKLNLMYELVLLIISEWYAFIEVRYIYNSSYMYFNIYLNSRSSRDQCIAYKNTRLKNLE